MKVLVVQLCLTLCDPVHCSLPGSSVHGILQARMQEWVYQFPSPGYLLNPGTELRSPVLQADSLPPETPGRPQGRQVVPHIVQAQFLDQLIVMTF